MLKKLPLFVVIALALFSCKKTTTETPYLFTEFAWGTNVNGGNLCPDAPVNAGDTLAVIQLNCSVEGDSFATTAAIPKKDLLLFAYNIERGYRGQDIIDLLMSKTELEIPDIIFMSEVDRYCARSFGGGNFARALADSLNMYYVYSVEFYEVDDNCEHGNAILSKYPLGNVEYHRFTAASTYYLYTDDGTNYRQGGRSYISADVKVGDDYIRVYSTHLEAYVFDVDIRESQTKQMIENAKNFNGPTIIAGDFNCYIYSLSLTAKADTLGIAAALFDANFEDTHTSIPPGQRITNKDFIDLIIDIFFVRNASYSNPGVGNTAAWEGLSDHSPVWTTVHID